MDNTINYIIKNVNVDVYKKKLIKSWGKAITRKDVENFYCSEYFDKKTQQTDLHCTIVLKG